jgi:hypothetical protein
MTVTPEDYVAVLKREEAVRQRSWEREGATMVRARECDVPEKLRPATSADIIKYAVIWYPEGQFDDRFWCIVNEPLGPDYWDAAYIAEDGCNYDLDGAYVEIE